MCAKIRTFTEGNLKYSRKDVKIPPFETKLGQGSSLYVPKTRNNEINEC